MTLMPEISALSLKASVVATPGSSPGVSLGGDLIPLRAAFGQDEANQGTARYSVDKDGLIQVPPEAVGPLTTVGGVRTWQRTATTRFPPAALTLHHDDAAGCSYAGRQYLGDSWGRAHAGRSHLRAVGASLRPLFDETLVALGKQNSAGQSYQKGLIQ